MKFRKKPVVIEADVWFKNGDHPEDGCESFDAGEGPFQGEGKVVRYYRTPECDGQSRCKHCNNIMHLHGWIDTLEGGHIVCPGDWIITGVLGERYPCKPAAFEATYEPVDSREEFINLTLPFEARMLSDLASVFEKIMMHGDKAEFTDDEKFACAVSRGIPWEIKDVDGSARPTTCNPVSVAVVDGKLRVAELQQAP